MDQTAVAAVTWNDVFAAFVLASLQRRFAIVEAKFAFGLFRAVTAKAGAFEDRLDIANKIDLVGRRRRNSVQGLGSGLFGAHGEQRGQCGASKEEAQSPARFGCNPRLQSPRFLRHDASVRRS